LEFVISSSDIACTLASRSVAEAPRTVVERLIQQFFDQPRRVNSKEILRIQLKERAYIVSVEHVTESVSMEK
jgi:hypothetical protein